ncbi:lysozyme inhibitor LprI family protein [Dongia soli]|uniref:Lysozyme inhibitor LprI family protein n=1 Tax=Dongia soli TaxID=600628 RepID=A0ABU5E7Q6_9PROT|nr:lysozyme inhibitor LprI family protein [Dongia soli]MDY0881932.1 lysozyme inhibitor LprI family protein [Dongia soli]
MMKLIAAVFLAGTVLWLAEGAAIPVAKADDIYDRCIDQSDGTNAAWSQCGAAFIKRADDNLNATWKRVYGAAGGQTKQDLLAEQRKWNSFKETSCRFYANGDWGRQGQVLDYAACRAGVIEERTKALDAYGKYFARQ